MTGSEAFLHYFEPKNLPKKEARLVPLAAAAVLSIASTRRAYLSGNDAGVIVSVFKAYWIPNAFNNATIIKLAI
jgi:hypothetical protein